MGRLLKSIVVLLIVAAVATILITPSAADDVPGVHHRSYPSPIAFIVAIGFAIAAIFRAQYLSASTTSHRLLPSELLDLVCQRLC